MYSKRAFISRAASLALVSGLASPAVAQRRQSAADAALDDLAGALASASSGQIVRPGQSAYAAVRDYNARFDCVRPKAYLRPATPEGVRVIVAWARRAGRTFAIRGGGHSFEGKSSHADLVIDMSQLRKLSFGTDGVLTVEAGVLLGDVYRTACAAGYIIPGGTCATVGIVGHALGGGLGDFLPMFGYTAQSLRSVTLVSMTGCLLTVTDDAIRVAAGDPAGVGDVAPRDLMTALRGGGQGSFGVVTGMTFQAHDVRSTTLASFKLEGASGLNGRKAAEIIANWMRWRETLPTPMQAMVSSKLNLSRSDGAYGIDIAGLIAIPPSAGVTLADVRQSLEVLFASPSFDAKRFSEPLTPTGAMRSFLDDGETTKNPKRLKLYGSSSVLPSALSTPAIVHLVEKLPAAIFVSLYTSGGRSTSAVATSLYPSEFLMEWTTYSRRTDASAHRAIATLRADVMRRAGFEDRAVANYPDDSARSYFTNQPLLDRLRAAFDPASSSTSSLLGPRPAATTAPVCR